MNRVRAGWGLVGCLALALGVLVGCTLGPGQAFATLVPGTLEATLSLPAGRLEDGAWKTSNGYLVRLEDGLGVTAGKLALLAPGSAAKAGSGETFDPAKPPAGYSLCHNGHCHRADGALVDYADIAAELASGGAASAPREVVTFAPQPKSAQPVAPGGQASWTLGEASPGLLLDRGSVSQTRWNVGFEARGQVTPEAGTASLSGGARTFRFQLAPADLSFIGRTPAMIDRTESAYYILSGMLRLSVRAFDGLDWARLAAAQPEGVLDLTADAASKETLLANLAQSDWQPTLKAAAAAP